MRIPTASLSLMSDVDRLLSARPREGARPSSEGKPLRMLP